MPERYAPTLSALSSWATATCSPTTTCWAPIRRPIPGWSGPYDIFTTFHEPMVLFGYLAAVTRLELVTGIIILPQRQTALVAKQAAEVDLLTGGRFRLGIGLGWNRVEYEALGRDFTNRGRRAEEQVELLRRLWTEQSVTFRGTDEQVTGAGIAPPPVQRPIPVWFGAQSPAAYRRAGRLGDGWFPQVPPGPQLDAARAIVEQAAVAAGRDPAAIGMEGRVSWKGDPAQLADQAGALGAGRRQPPVGQHHGRRAGYRRRAPGRARACRRGARPDTEPVSAVLDGHPQRGITGRCPSCRPCGWPAGRGLPCPAISRSASGQAEALARDAAGGHPDEVLGFPLDPRLEIDAGVGAKDDRPLMHLVLKGQRYRPVPAVVHQAGDCSGPEQLHALGVAQPLQYTPGACR